MPVYRLFLLVFLLFFCSQTTTYSATQERITITHGYGCRYLPAPYLSKRGPDMAYTSFLFDTLTWKDEQGGIIPALARS